MNESISPAAISLAALSVEYCKVIANCRNTSTKLFLRDILRYLPRIYITIADIDPYGDGPDAIVEETMAIYDTLTEDQYNEARLAIEATLGENDMYLDTMVDDMRYSDSPVAVSLAEKLADLYQDLADYAATVGQAVEDMIPDVLADLKFRFSEYLSETICSALKAANFIYLNANLDNE
ncbi:MAG: DUF5063 domain-containing protein [Muribaculaceae bacterium]|nr:DUF5063 domain-containing protein [Muribaculaceae bacterium]